MSSALLESLAMKYGYPYAAKLLGIDKQQGNPKYTFGMPFTNNKISFDPMKMIGNQALKSVMGGGKMSSMIGPGLLLGGALALGYARNPLREGSMNYNPYLKDQISYLNKNKMINRNNSAGLLRYGEDSILSGQGVVSLFGTNDYIGQLKKYKDKYGDTMSQERLDKLDKELMGAEHGAMMQELAEEKKAADIKAKNTMTSNQSYNGGGGGGGGAADISDRNRGGYATDDTASFFSKGGIASL